MTNEQEQNAPAEQTLTTSPTTTESAAPAPTSLLGESETQAAAATPEFDFAEVDLEGLKSFIPEGAEVDEGLATEFLTMINGAKSRADMVKGAVALQEKIQTQAVEAMQTQWQETQNSWREEVKADKEIGGANLEPNLAKALEVVNTYAGDAKAVKELFALSGVGNNIHMVKLLMNIAKAIPGESKPVEGSPAPVEKSRAQRLFGSA